MDYPDKDGVTLRRQLEQVEASSGIRDELLDKMVVPAEGEFVWNIFWKVAGKFNFEELDAYCRVAGIHLDLWEVEIISKMEGAMSSEIARMVKIG